MGYSNSSSPRESNHSLLSQDYTPDIGIDEGKEPSNSSSSSITPPSAPQNRYHPYLPSAESQENPCSTLQKKLTERKSKGYLFDDLIREYHPPSTSEKNKAVIKVNGHNILNVCNIDSIDAFQKIQKKREQHNRVERRRRSLMNHSIDELWDLIPSAVKEGSKCARSSVIKVAVDYIKLLSDQNDKLREENDNLKRHQTLHLPPPEEPAHPSPTLSSPSSSLPPLISCKPLSNSHASSHNDMEAQYWRIPELSSIPTNPDHSHHPQPIEPTFRIKQSFGPYPF
ncbi:hypothetical protein CONCODRAFT_78783 [Conidiobolus coronatus NRRL 28638]|uniref:BHLH domain-containing protein n=1 Tax=Conidiobolus coronatus (strain ATCC 28846 / CBS 209.66 / NRRL 28638) TaxID=796925 RepID=A0A137P690_CONC2|nr:hypothetical protein CONCODRAFT_78783 [Conidiobolus coronatus NRRL 28638]|eukprot:KXN70523.1 hypothetical protein CONCODRAFT_78783 [Conidiobolus coronatus NRRL 28638]